MTRKRLFVSIGVGWLLFSVIAAVGYARLVWKPPTVLETIARIQSAIEERDARAFGDYVDVDAVCTAVASQAGLEAWGDEPAKTKGAAKDREWLIAFGRGTCAKATAEAILNGRFGRFSITVGSVERVGDASVAVVTVEDGKTGDKTDIRLRLRMMASSWQVFEVGNLRTLVDKAHLADKE